MQGFKPGSMPAHKQKGGKIKGPGSGTSDSIKADIPKGSYIMPADSTQQIGPQALGELGEQVPVNVSNGEYQMPPEQVHAVGVQALAFSLFCGLAVFLRLDLGVDGFLCFQDPLDDLVSGFCHLVFEGVQRGFGFFEQRLGDGGRFGSVCPKKRRHSDDGEDNPAKQ